jgi:chromate reductase, NAD(P)H dehydrogenase (quinone)
MTEDTDRVGVLGFAGSLRKASYNKMALGAVADVLPPAMTLDIFDLLPIPLYNGDVEDAGFPDSVQAFRQAIAAADALLIVTPEYNHSFPGVLKNALDWASLPPQPPLAGKPVAIMGVTPGGWGTTRAQAHLRQVLVANDMRPLSKPDVMVAGANKKFDGAGHLTDEATRRFIGDLMAALGAWTRTLRGA